MTRKAILIYKKLDGNNRMNAPIIRQKFIDFFVKHTHEYVASSSLIPAQDPTLLFANAGMNQFKDLFLGLEKRSYTRAVSIQKCVRAGGKHNDLDNVGFTKRHLTFFEMMGNFSFGDYFKKEAIQFAWDFLTREIGLHVDTLHASVHETDDEAYNLWKDDIGLSQEKIHKLGDADNFWQMGDVGPCGPCSEIYVDRGISFGCGKTDGCGPACGCDRFLEVWNLVFMQYDRQRDGSLKELGKKGVDTGMGFERLCAISQNKDSVFAIDAFAPIISAIEKNSGKSYASAPLDVQAAFHVLADHIRSSSFLIADGCAPSNDGRGYVLRKIIRRAALFAQKLSDDPHLFPTLSYAVVEQMGDVYPELLLNKKLIYAVLSSEIERFSANLIRGTAVLEKFFIHNSATKTISGTDAFTLYDTYGFPVELITATARERGYGVDMVAYEQCMAHQKRQSGTRVIHELDNLALDESIKTEFTGYTELETNATIIALIKNGLIVEAIDAGDTCFIITDKSPFFIVGGGQVPDQGWIQWNSLRIPLLSVRYIQKGIAAEIVAPIALHVGDAVVSIVNRELRANAMKNHTATHLLQSALITLFGKQIKQSGSVVDPDYLRFDFTYHTHLSSDDIVAIEQCVNNKIYEDITVVVDHMTLRDATHKGVIAFFGDKYNPDSVRVVNVGDFSAELCGGTHVQRTGEIGIFKIIEVSAPAAGHRRILALTGPKALEHYQTMFAIAKGLSQEFSVKPEEVPGTVLKQKAELRALEKQVHLLQRSLWQAQLPQWQKDMHEYNGIPVLCLIVDGSNPDDLREIVAMLSAQKTGIYFVASNEGGRAHFVVKISSEYVQKINTSAFIEWLKTEYALKCGGKSGELQGGGLPLKLEFNNAFYAWIKNHVQ
jgi:alanyl-tRNA synthetase